MKITLSVGDCQTIGCLCVSPLCGARALEDVSPAGFKYCWTRESLDNGLVII